MADIANKYAENVSGKFYVDDQCISALIATCAEKPHPSISRAAATAATPMCLKQPTTPEEEALCKEAIGRMSGCPTDKLAFGPRRTLR
jgi:ferredoxin